MIRILSNLKTKIAANTTPYTNNIFKGQTTYFLIKKCKFVSNQYVVKWKN